MDFFIGQYVFQGKEREKNKKGRKCRRSQIAQRATTFEREPLQDFTVLPTEKFRRCVIRSSSVIFLPTSSPTDYVRRLSFRRWFPLPSLYRSEKQKNHLPMVLQTEFARQKKKDSRLKYTDGFVFRRWYCDWPTETNRR